MSSIILDVQYITNAAKPSRRSSSQKKRPPTVAASLMSAILTSLVDELSSSGSWLCLHGLHCRARIIRVPIVVWPRAFCPFGSARCRDDRMRANSRNTHSTYSIDRATMCAPPEEFLKRGVKPALIRDVGSKGYARFIQSRRRHGKAARVAQPTQVPWRL
jgi:hypothetical protein